MNAAHTGVQSGTAAPPLRQLWAVDLGGRLSYPLIAGGRIFVVAEKPTDPPGGTPTTWVYAFDARTGVPLWAPIQVSRLQTGYVAYDGGRLIVQGWDEPLRAYDAATGAPLWSVYLPYQTSYDAPPAADAGVIYTVTNNSTYAVRASDGHTLWIGKTYNGGIMSSPAVSPDGVFVTWVCARNDAFERATGAVRWSTTSGCSGGGGTTPAYEDGNLYVRDYGGPPGNYPQGNMIVDPRTGAKVGTFPGRVSPALDGPNGYFLDGSVLRAQVLASGADRWTFTGDGALNSAPVVMNGYLYEASSQGTLFAVRTTDGKQVWSAALGSPFLPPREDLPPTDDIAVGQNLVAVPATNRLVVFGK
ncbi:MAG: PQQ-binding-like beta-propeller repeat protein [Acidimicrobiia bacterium]|nr:PQQ-binding-like beta-propeller repeat protein [Acidimicrobiia bacterium]